MTTPRLCGRKPRLTLEQARELRRWAEFGTTRAEVARRLGVTPDTVTRYVRGMVKNYQRMA